jgi:hypothetical protein
MRRVNWARRVPVDQIPCILVFLAGRLLAEDRAPHRQRHG